MIELTLARFEFTNTCTLSSFYVGGEYRCYFLEDAIRKEKIYGKTAIPRGRYRVDFTFSGRFGRQLPLLLDVPLYSGIRIHQGNANEDTDGCLLPGYDRYRNGDEMRVYRSREALEKIILPIFQNPQEEVYLTILGGYSASEMSSPQSNGATA